MKSCEQLNHEWDAQDGFTKPADNKKTKEPKEKIVYTSKIIKDGVLWEQIYNPETKQAQYITWDEKNTQPVLIPEHFINGLKHQPINDQMLEKGAVVLPTGLNDYGDVPALQKDINDFIYKYLDISEEHRQKAVWYVQLSWVLDNLHTIPYLRALGDYGSGKTRYEDIIGGICYKPTYVGGSVRSAPIYRVIDLWRGTAIFDEFTLSRTDETLDIVQILNCGYQRGKPVLRCRDGNYSEVECFDPFCAKILVSKKQFDDRALESRCITEVIRETDRTDIPIDLGENFFKERGELQNKLLMYRLKNWNKIKHDESIKIDFGRIQPRIKQTFLPFTVLFYQDTQTLMDFIETVKKHNTLMVEENSSSIDGLIVNIFLELKKDASTVAVTSQDIRNSLVNKHGFNPDKTTAGATVGKRLKPMGFKSTSVTRNGETKREIEIRPDDIKKLIYRYVLPEKQQEYIEIAGKLDSCQQKTMVDF